MRNTHLRRHPLRAVLLGLLAALALGWRPLRASARAADYVPHQVIVGYRVPAAVETADALRIGVAPPHRGARAGQPGPPPAPR